MPAYNVEGLVGRAVASVPAFVQRVVVVDDHSTDGTAEELRRAAAADPARVVVVRHERNRGVGAAIATGSDEAVRLGAEVVAVMAGDGQMDPADLAGVVEPVVAGRADYVKGNRFRHPDLWKAMPKTRIVGNIALSLMTRVTSGYHHIFDSQCGYTAVSAEALAAVRGRMFSRYGYPNDLLARLNSVGARVEEVCVRPVYDGQPSGIRLRTVFYPILFVLARSMVRRLRRRLTPLPRSSSPPLLQGTDRANRRSDHFLPTPPP